MKFKLMVAGLAGFVGLLVTASPVWSAAPTSAGGVGYVRELDEPATAKPPPIDSGSPYVPELDGPKPARPAKPAVPRQPSPAAVPRPSPTTTTTVVVASTTTTTLSPVTTTTLPPMTTTTTTTVPPPKPPAAPPTDPYGRIPPVFRRWMDLVAAASRKYDLPSSFIFGVMMQESGGRNARQPGGGGRCMMQIDVNWHPQVAERAFQSPAVCVDYGASLLHANRVRFGGDLRLAAAAYNAGVGCVARHIHNPDICTTGNYSADVMRNTLWFHQLGADARPK